MCGSGFAGMWRVARVSGHCISIHQSCALRRNIEIAGRGHVQEVPCGLVTLMECFSGRTGMGFVSQAGEMTIRLVGLLRNNARSVIAQWRKVNEKPEYMSRHVNL